MIENYRFTTPETAMIDFSRVSKKTILLTIQNLWQKFWTLSSWTLSSTNEFKTIKLDFWNKIKFLHHI